MKIAFLVDHFPSMTQTFILNQITGMIDRGHSVEIFTGKIVQTGEAHTTMERYNLLSHTTAIGGMEGFMPSTKVARGAKAMGLILKYLGKDPLPIIRALNVFRHGKRAASFYLLYQITSILAKGDFDIIHCQFGPLGLKALEFRSYGILRGKLVVSFRGFDVTQYMETRPNCYAELFKKGDLFLPVSEDLLTKVVIAGCPQDKACVHHSGIDCQKFVYTERLFPKDGPVNILTTARLTEKKGICYAIEAIASLVSAGVSISYTIVGEGSLRQKLENQIATLGLSGFVHLVGWRNHEEVFRFLAQSHILIAPSITAADGDQEGIPNAIKEAMAVGLMVIGTRHGGIPELIEDGISGYLVRERSIEDLEKKLRYLIDHPEKWPAMGKAGRARVEKEFDMNSLNNQLEILYQNICD